MRDCLIVWLLFWLMVWLWGSSLDWWFGTDHRTIHGRWLNNVTAFDWCIGWSADTKRFTTIDYRGSGYKDTWLDWQNVIECHGLINQIRCSHDRWSLFIVLAYFLNILIDWLIERYYAISTMLFLLIYNMMFEWMLVCLTFIQYNMTLWWMSITFNQSIENLPIIILSVLGIMVLVLPPAGLVRGRKWPETGLVRTRSRSRTRAPKCPIQAKMISRAFLCRTRSFWFSDWISFHCFIIRR